jgi:hypothetical protein
MVLSLISPSSVSPSIHMGMSPLTEVFSSTSICTVIAAFNGTCRLKPLVMKTFDTRVGRTIVEPIPLLGHE